MKIKHILRLAGLGAFAGGYLAAGEKVSEEAYAPFQNRFIAHRGLHSGDGAVPENSLKAFDKAGEKGYGVELDVTLSKDGQVVVFHDDDLKRVCGVDGFIGDRTLEELQSLSLLESDQTIPLFTEVLDVYAGRGPMIVELKKTPGRNDELCEKTLAILKEYTGDYCVESFDPTIVAWFRENAPEIVRGQLACKAEDYGTAVPQWKSLALSLCLMNVKSRPHFIAYDLVEKPITVRFAEFLGAKRVCWTSRKIEDTVGQDTVIFEGYEPPLTFAEEEE